MNENDTATVMHQFNTDKRFRLELDPKILLPLLAFCEKNIVRYFVLMVSMMPLGDVLSKFIIPFLYIFLLATYIKKYGFDISIKEFGVLFFITSAILLSCLIYPINASYILDPNNFWNTIFPCLRFYIVGLVIVPDKRTMDLIGKASCIAILVETIFVIFYMMPRGLLKSDDMSRAYQILPNVLLSINYAFSNRKKSAWLLSIVGVIYVCSMGARGPLVIILAYYFIKILQHTAKNRTYKIIISAFIVLLGAIFINSQLYLTVLGTIQSIFSEFGLSTRIIDLALNNEMVTHTSGRDEIYAILKSKIAERPILGYGVYGEWQWIHWNAHNIFLEIMVHYGVILGSFILLWMVSTIIRSYSSTSNKEAKDMILIWACFVFVRGFFGGSYLQFSVFFLIGFCMREISRISCNNNKVKG